MREVTAADIPGLKLALEHSTKYQDQCWFSFLIKMYERKYEINRPRIKLIGAPTQFWNKTWRYTSVFSENGQEREIVFILFENEWPTDETIRMKVGHELYLCGENSAGFNKAEVIREKKA